MEHGSWSARPCPLPCLEASLCACPLQPYLAEDVEDSIGGKEVSHVHAGILHPDPLEGSRESSGDTGRCLRVGIAPTEAAGHKVPN